MKHIGIVNAFLAALLFGASTPFAKLLMGDISPVVLAGLLYLGSGLGLSAWLVARRLASASESEASLTGKDMPPLAGAIFTGGIVAPVLLMTGTNMIPASASSLLLNLEGVCTTLLAWFVFKESFDRRIFIGMLLIIAGGVVLTFTPHLNLGGDFLLGGALVAAACLCWGIDNNLTRKVSGGNPAQIAALKGLFAGSITLSAASMAGFPFPALSSAFLAGVVGLAGYGVSLILFILALRHLGTARTGAYFSIAPFAGAAISFGVLAETPDTAFWVASLFMAAGVFLHLTETHAHEHAHDETEHGHRHVHDEHHQHAHDFEWDGKEPHTHVHRHEKMAHSHPHYPDIHHRHRH